MSKNFINKGTSTKFSKDIEQYDSIFRILVLAAAGLIVILGTRAIARDLISPVLLAGFIAVLMYPIYKGFRSRGLSGTISLILMVLTIGGGIFLFGVFLTWSFGKFFDSIEVYFQNFSETVDSLIASTGLQIDMDLFSFESISNSFPIEPIQDILSQGSLINILSTLAGGIWNLFYLFIFIPFVAILLIMHLESIPQKTVGELTENSPFVRKMQKFAEAIITYIVARGKVNLFTGVVFAICLAFIGVDFAILWGILVVFLSFIPYIGIVVASIPPVVIALATLGWVGAALVIISVIVVNVLAENVIDPFVQGHSSKISAVTIIIMLIFWSWLLGPVGALLSVPLTVLIKLILADYKETYWIAKIMEGGYSEATESSRTSEFIINLRDRFSRR